MRPAYIVAVAACALLLGAGQASAIGCDAEEQAMHTVIRANAACETDAECTLVSMNCPFGCGTAVRRDKAEDVMRAYKAYEQRCGVSCMYKCAALKTARCVNHVCEGAP